MKLKKFEDIINIIKVQDKLVSELYDRQVSLIDFTENYNKIISKLLVEYYGIDGEEMISWFLYERTDENKLNAYETINGEKVPICYDIPSLWEYVEKSKTNKTNKTNKNE